MLIKAITLFRIRAVGDFSLWLTLMKQSVTLRQNIDTHTIFSQLFSFTLRYKLYLSEYSSSRLFFFTCFMCIWSFGRTKTQKCPLLVSLRARRARTHTRTHTHTHIHGEQRLSCGLYFQRFIKYVQQFSNCKDCILQQSTDDWSDSDVEFWSGKNECAPLWREGSCARKNTAIIFRS